MELKFYRYTGEIDLVNKSSILNAIEQQAQAGTFAKVNGTFRVPTDLANPVVLVEWDLPEVAQNTNFLDFNYCTSRDLNRSYFVDSIVMVSDALTEVHLREDVLNSHQSVIYSQRAFLNRSGLGSLDIEDPAVKFKADPLILDYDQFDEGIRTATGNLENVEFSTSANDLSTVIQCFSDPSLSGTFPPNVGYVFPAFTRTTTPQANFLPQVQRTHFSVGGLSGTPVDFTYPDKSSGTFYLDLDDDELIVLENFIISDDTIRENVRGAVALPFKIPTEQHLQIPYWNASLPDPTSDPDRYSRLLDPLIIGGKRIEKTYTFGGNTYTVGLVGSLVNPYSEYLILADITIPKPTNDFLSRPPYSRYEIYVPFCGWLNVPYENIGHRLIVYYTVDYASGQGTAYIYDMDLRVLVWSSACQIGVSLDLTGTNQAELNRQKASNALNTILQVAGGMITTVAGVATENPVAIGAGVLSIARGVGGGIANRANMVERANIGFSGGTSALFSPLRVQIKILRMDPTETLSNIHSFIGKPDLKMRNLSTLANTGFGNVSDIHLENVGEMTKQEQDEIIRLLKQGVKF